MLYHSKKPTVHYLFPEGYTFPRGDFEIYSIKNEKISVDKKEIETYKIPNSQAFKLLNEEMNQQISSFVKGMKEVASKISGKDKSKHEESNSDSEKLSDKISHGIEFLTLTTKAISLFWKVMKTDENNELIKHKEGLISLKQEFQKKGYEPGSDFEEIPFKLKEKYNKEGKLKDLRESGKEFEEILENIKKENKK